MERVAQITSRQPCFGVEYRPDKTCVQCPYVAKCSAFVKQHVPLSTLKFNFTPEKLDQSIVEPEEINSKVVEDMFRRSFYRVYRAWPKQSVGQHWELVLANARTSKLPLETFIVTVLLSWNITRPKTPFPVSMLTRPLAPDKVMEYARICRDTKGHAGAAALGELFEIDLTCVDSKLLRSEILFGNSIIGWKLHKGTLDFEYIYGELEATLDPYWLAIEPSYTEHVLKPYLRDEIKSSSLQREIRSCVTQHIGLMKRRPRIATSVFAMRARVMQNALNSVLDKWGHKPDNFTHMNVTVSDAAKFWNFLGMAVLHYECLKAIDCQPHRLWGHSC